MTLKKRTLISDKKKAGRDHEAHDHGERADGDGAGDHQSRETERVENTLLSNLYMTMIRFEHRSTTISNLNTFWKNC